MLGLTKSLARELGPHGIRVNAVSPGAVVSEAEKRVFADRLEEYNRLGAREPVPEDAHQAGGRRELILFLVSPASDMITGQNLPIDGGW